MFRSVLDEMRRRRLLPVAALALLVAIIAPLLFLKGAPDGAPSADSAAPAAATPAKLPARAARLLAANDGDASNGATKGSAQDPFNPPSSVRAAAAAAAKGGAATTAPKSATAKSSGTSAGKTTEPIPVVIKNDDGKSSAKSNPSASTAPKSTRSSTRTIAVDIRFGAKKDSKIRRAIPSNQALYIHGKLVAVFVKYSPSRKKAIFAVAPGVHISGPASSRVTDNVRYVDIKPGSHARLTLVTPSRTIVSRRLDVVRAKARTSSNTTRATAAGARTEAACLLGKLTAMKPGDSLIRRDACER